MLSLGCAIPFKLNDEYFILCTLFLQDNGNFHRVTPQRSPAMGWPGVQGVPATPVVKRVIRLDVPADKYPNVS